MQVSLRPQFSRTLVRHIGIVRSHRRTAHRLKPLNVLVPGTGGILEDTIVLLQIGGISFTVLQLVRRLQKLRQSPTGVTDSMDLDMEDEDEADSMGILSLNSSTKWATMGVVSALPLLGFTAWLFAKAEAPQSPSSSFARPYYVFAALYASPLLFGVSVSPFSITAAALCALHIQLERIRETEPEAALPFLAPLVGSSTLYALPRPDIPRELGSLVDSLRSKLGTVSRMTLAELALASEERRALEDLRASEQLAALELSQWDAAFQQRQREVKRELDGEPLGRLRGAARVLGVGEYTRLSRGELVAVLQGEIDRLGKGSKQPTF